MATPTKLFTGCFPSQPICPPKARKLKEELLLEQDGPAGVKFVQNSLVHERNLQTARWPPRVSLRGFMGF